MKTTWTILKLYILQYKKSKVFSLSFVFVYFSFHETKAKFPIDDRCVKVSLTSQIHFRQLSIVDNDYWLVALAKLVLVGQCRKELERERTKMALGYD